MRNIGRCLVSLILGTLLLSGCSKKEPEQTPPEKSSQAPAPQPQPAPAPAQPAPSKAASASPPAPSEKKTPAAAPETPSPAQTPQATPAPPAPKTAKPSRPLPELVPANPVETTPAPAKQPSAAQAPKLTPKDEVILKASLGGVRFQHKLHVEGRAPSCEVCHHASHAEKPAAAPQQACSTCHTPVAVPPMTTKLQAAFHNPSATQGACIDCHKAQNAKGKAAPTKCLDCHKKANS